MRRHFKAHGRSRGKPRMKKDWIILGQTDCPHVDFDMVPCVVDPAGDLSTVNTFSFVDAADIASKEDSCTIVRMVGEIYHGTELAVGGVTGAVNPFTLLTWCDEAIYLASEGDATGSGEIDPRLASQGENDNIMWRRRLVYSFTMQSQLPAADGFRLYAANTEPDGPMGSHLDIRVSRKLKQGDQLLYSYAWRFFNQPGTPAFTATLLTSLNMRGFLKF